MASRAQEQNRKDSQDFSGKMKDSVGAREGTDKHRVDDVQVGQDMTSDDAFKNTATMYETLRKELDQLVNCSGTEHKCAEAFGRTERAYARLTAVERWVLYPLLKEQISNKKVDGSLIIAHNMFVQQHEHWDKIFELVGKWYKDSNMTKTTSFKKALQELQQELQIHQKWEDEVFKTLIPTVGSQEKSKLLESQKETYNNVPREVLTSYGSFTDKISKTANKIGNIFGSGGNKVGSS